MHRRARVCAILLLAIAWLATPAPILAQVVTSVPATGLPLTDGTIDYVPTCTDSGVAFIDSALPRTMLRTRFDLDYGNRRPTRAEYLFPRGGLPNSPGMILPETRVQMQELFVCAEVALTPHFSFFTEQPFRWVNPEVNANESGSGDLNLGMKWALVCDERVATSVQLRAYIPSGSGRSMGTDHFSLEPALLVNYRLADYLTLEGEFRYWAPIGGTDFAGDLIRYGLGLVYGMRCSNEIWLTPVVEVVGWTILDGRMQVASSPTTFTIEDASGTIVNGNLGVRIGFGDRADIYAGYGRAFTGAAWFRDIARVELRLFF